MFEVYAIFDSDTNYYTSDKTPIYDVWFSGNVKDTKLIFDSLPKSITSGETITFSGQLLDSDGTPLAGKAVQIKNHLKNLMILFMGLILEAIFFIEL